MPGGIKNHAFSYVKLSFGKQIVDFTSCLSILGACYAGKIDVFFEKLHFYLHKVTKLMNFDQKVSLKGSLARERWRIVNTDVPGSCFIFTS